LYLLTGESIVFDRSSELQALRRKHLSVAFYKEKMQANLRAITEKTCQKVDKWKSNCKNGPFEMDIVKEILGLLMEIIQNCVFG